MLEIMASTSYLVLLVYFEQLKTLQFQIVGAISVALPELISAWTEFSRSLELTLTLGKVRP